MPFDLIDLCSDLVVATVCGRRVENEEEKRQQKSMTEFE